MTSEEMIKPSDEILFCYLYFNEIYAFIKYGLPSKFEGLLNKYPKIKTYYGSQWRNNDSYEYAGIATDGKHKGEQMYNKKIGTGLVGLYEYDRGNNYQSYLLKWNLDYQNKGFRAKIQGGAPCKIDVYDVCEQDVFRAISVFFHICKSVSGDENYGKITNALNEALQIMTLKTYVMDTDSLQIIQQAESLFIIILGYFGMNNPSRNINFSQRIDQWCDAACGGKEYAPYYNVKNALNFYRSIRNDSAHGSRLIPGQRDEVTFALYLCILVVYLCLKHKPDVSVRLDPECNIQCRINGEVKLGDKIIQGKGNDEYDLEPFAEYTVNGHSFKLDWECYGATVNDKGDITHKEYQIGQFPSEAIGAFLAEKLKGADNAVIQNMISLLNEQTDKLSTDIVELQTGLKNELSRLADCKDNINEKVEEVVNRFNEQQNQLLGKLDKIEIGIRDIAARVDNTSQKVDEAKESLSAGNEKIQKTLDEIGAEKKKAKEERIEKEKVRKKRTQIIVGSVAFIALLSAGYYLWDFLYNTADGAFAREDYQLAYEKGHPDAAYEYARRLENEKKYEEAAAWYKKAQTVYDNRLKAEETAGTSDIKSRIRLAQMYLRAKGGIYDPRKAFSCLEPIKNTKEGIGLYVYCCAHDGEKLQEALDQLSYAEKIAPDEEYVLLTKSLVRLMMPSSKEKRTEENCAASWKTLEQLAAKESEVREEALFCMALLYLQGYYKEDEALHYNLYKGMDYLREAAFEAKSINAQTCLGEYLCRLYSFEEGYHAFDVAYRNGMVDALAKMFDVAVAMGQSEKADSLRNAYAQKAQTDPFIRNVFDLEKRESRQAWLYQKEAFAAFDPTKHWINTEFVKNYVCNGLKTNISVDTILKIDPSLDRNYVKAIKYAQGYGVEKNQTLADSLILLAVKDSLPDAIYTWGRLLDRRGKTLEAIAMLKRTADFDPRAAEWLAHIYRDIDWQRAKEYLAKVSDPSRAYKQVVDFWVWGSHFKDVTLWVDDKQAPSWADKLERELCIQLGVYQDVSSISFLAGELACYYASRREPDDVAIFYLGIASKLGKEGYFSWLEFSSVCYFIGRLDMAGAAYMEFCLGYFRMKKPENVSMEERKEIVEYLRAYFPDMEEPLKKELGFDFTKGIERTDKKNPTIRFTRTIQPDEPIYKY